MTYNVFGGTLKTLLNQSIFASLIGERYCITVPPCPEFIWGTAFPHKIFGDGVPLRLHHCINLCSSLEYECHTAIECVVCY